MEENIKITNDIIKAVYAHISKRYLWLYYL